MNNILVGIIAVSGWVGVLLLCVFIYKMNENWYRHCCEQNEDWSHFCDNVITEMAKMINRDDKNDANENEVVE